jgi:hypothetical protein
MLGNVFNSLRSTPIKQRLIGAYRRHLAVISEDQLPGDIRDSFGLLLRSLCGVQPLRGEDAVTASVRKMSNQEADDCAALIVEMFGRICRLQAVSPRPVAPLVKLHSVDNESEFEIPSLIASN